MAVTLLNAEPGVVTFRQQRWWAEGGLIHLEEKLTGEQFHMTVREALLRMNAISEMIGRSSRGDKNRFASEIAEHHDFFEAMVQLCKKAQQQGRPDVASHREQMLNAMAPRSIVVPDRRANF